jgi:hypothetical protein
MDRNVGESQPRRRCFSSNTQDGNGAGGSRQVQHWVEEAERLDELEAERGLTGVEAVSRPFPSWNRSISTEIYLCHACSCQEILRTETAGQVLAQRRRAEEERCEPSPALPHIRRTPPPSIFPDKNRRAIGESQPKHAPTPYFVSRAGGAGR